MNSVVCYTCITGGYDSLKAPKIVSASIDYICFTDSSSIQSDVWQIRPVPQELAHLSNVKKQRIVKICPHRYLKEYSISIWVDGNIQIAGDLMQFVQQYDLDACPFYTRVHPSRKCIYDEAEACISMGKDTAKSIKTQVQQYQAEGYPKHAGMVETCIILRKHNDVKCQMLDNLWASELLKHSHRDQLSFNYACWKLHFIPGIMKNEFKISNEYFKITHHG